VLFWHWQGARQADGGWGSELDSGTHRNAFRRVALVYPEPGKNSPPSKMAPQGVFPQMGSVGARAHSAVHDLPLGFSQDRVGVQGWALLPSMGTGVGLAFPDWHTAKHTAAYLATFSYLFPPANCEFCVR
jgi:hypothetical protein